MSIYSYTQSFGTLAVSGSTPYGTYDNDSAFTIDCQKTAVWCARKMGYPLLKVEIQDIQLYGAYEEAALKYNGIITAHQATNWFLDLIGSKVSSSYTNYTNQIPRSDMGFIKRLLDPNALEAGVGADAKLYTGSFVMPANEQIYDLKAWGLVSASGHQIQIKDMYHDATPAMLRVPYLEYLPGSWQWDWYQADYSTYAVPAGMFAHKIYPVFSNVLREQEVNMYSTVRRSNYSYVIHDNLLRITPTPGAATTIWFTYYREDLNKEHGIEWNTSSVSASTGNHIITNLANVPMEAIAYSTLNPLAKDWIRRYALAVSKEILGNIRGKFQTIPIPGGEVTLDGSDLRNAATEEKRELMEEIKAQLEEISFEKLLEKKSNIAESIARVTARAPFRRPVVIG